MEDYIDGWSGSGMEFRSKSREELLRDEYPELKELWMLFIESRDLNTKLRGGVTFMSYIFHRRFNIMARIVKRTQRRLDAYEVTLKIMRPTKVPFIGAWT